MRKFEEGLGHWVLRWRWIILITTLVLIAAAASGMRHLMFTTDYRIFFSDNNPQLLAFDALERTFTKTDNVMFLLSPRDGNVFTTDTLAAIESLTEKAWKIPHSIRVDSLANFQHTRAQDDDLTVAHLVTDASNLTEDQIRQIRDIALDEPLLINRLVSDKGDVTGVNVTVQLPGKNEQIEVPDVVRDARRLADEITKAYPHLEIRLAGMVFMNNAFSEASQQDGQTLYPLALLLMMIALALMIRGITGTGVTLLVIILSIMAAMGVGGHLGFPITPPSASAPVIILTVAIANCVHVLITLLHSMRKGLTKQQAVVESLRVNLQPVTLTSVTTIIGFLSMNFSEVPPFQHLGNFVAFGVAASWILALTFLPALIAVVPLHVKAVPHYKDKMMGALGNFVVRKRKALLVTVGAAATVFVAFIPRNELNDVFVHYFDTRVPFRQASDYMNDHLTGPYVIDYILDSGRQGGISDPNFLAEVDKFAAWYREQQQTRHVNTITDILRRLNKNLHADDPAFYKLPEDRNLSAQYLLLYEMSLPYGLDLNNQINVGKSSTRFSVSVNTLSSNELLELEQRAKDWLAANAPHIVRAQATGPTIMFAHIGKRNIISMLSGTAIALVLISAILIFAMRSVRLGLISMIPNIIPAAMGFGLWGLVVGEVGLALSVVTGMTLGIVVDDTIHFLSKYLRARREHQLPTADAVRYAFNTVGRAMGVTSIVLVVGFSVLALSAFKLNAAMGLLSAIVIVFALIADYLLLPPLLMTLEREKNDQKSPAAILPDSAAA